MAERHVCVSEGLGKQGQQHGNLAAGAVYAQLNLTELLIGHNMLERDLIKHLVENAHHTEQQYRPCVGQHTTCQLTVEPERDAFDLLYESESHGECAEQVHKEYETYTIVILNIDSLKSRHEAEHLGHEPEHKYVEQNVWNDERHLKGHELDGAVLLSETAEQDSLESIKSRYKGKTNHIFRMIRITQIGRYGINQALRYLSNSYGNDHFQQNHSR